jgi:hypothetical protein
VRGHTLEAEIFLGTNDEERARPVDLPQPGKVQVATVNAIEGAGLKDEIIEDIDFVHRKLGYPCKHREN